jgi:hypothetical protein
VGFFLLFFLRFSISYESTWQDMGILFLLWLAIYEGTSAFFLAIYMLAT